MIPLRAPQKPPELSPVRRGVIGALAFKSGCVVGGFIAFCVGYVMGQDDERERGRRGA